MKGGSLSESLTGWTGFPKPDTHFEPRMTRAAAQSVRKLLVDVEPRAPDLFDLEQLHRRVTTEWRRSRSLDAIRPRDLSQLPWVLFYPLGRDRKRWLGTFPRFVELYRQWLMRGRRTRPLAALLHEFLRVYPTDLPTFDKIRLFLRRALYGGETEDPPSLRKWGERCERFHLLEADRGKRFVFDVLAGSTSPDQMLDDAGLARGLAHSGFLKSGILTALREWVPTRSLGAASDAMHGRLLALLEYEDGLRFDDRPMRVEVASGLLAPCIDRAPVPQTKEALQSFFLKHFRDPRLPSGKHRWSGVSEDIRRVMIRWLVERALDQFFMLLKETAYDQHWRYREAFWRAFLDEGYIDDIWFVLGSQAEAMLEVMSDDPEALETTAELYGAQSDQSVLLMRMPGITIAEWSHSGSCHLWLDGAQGAPDLYEQDYDAYELRRPYPYPRSWNAHSQRHDGSQRGRWQDKIASWLRKNTGIDVNRNRYFPVRLR